jgi:ABC-type Fe3+-hydroxamate transport system substrate-binding protein
MISSRKFIVCAAAVAAFTAGLSWNGSETVSGTSFFSEAQAVIGRPLTPMSYAGVARRTTRRAVAVGAAAGAYGSSCVQVVDAYGRVVTRC